MHQIERGIYYETMYLGVTLGGLVYSHGTILIDAPLRLEDGRSWRSSLLNQRGGANRLLVNLDAHPDRTLGARAMDCTIVAHQKTGQVFRSRPTIFKGQSEEGGAAWESYGDSIGMRWATPDITFTERMSLHWGGPEIVLKHQPGPQTGSSWVIIPAERVVFVGDTVVLDQPPFLENADLAAWQESLDQLSSAYRDYMIISGRGGPVAGEAIRLQQHVLMLVAKGIERLSKANAPPEATEELISSIKAEYSFPPERLEQYTSRLRYGLSQNYIRRFRPENTLEQPPVEDEEQ